MTIPNTSARKEAHSSFLFMPRPLRRARAIKWLRRTHAWFALWGGVAGMLFGLTGILMNHRAVMTIPAVQTSNVSAQLTLSGPQPQSAEELARWLGRELKLDSQPRIVREPAQQVAWSKTLLVQPERWEIVFNVPQRMVTAEYWRGNTSVNVKTRSGNAFYLLTRLHMAIGVNPAWILLADSIAGSLLMLTLTGLLLWTRLHGPRLLALGLLGSSLTALAVAAVLSI